MKKPETPQLAHPRPRKKTAVFGLAALAAALGTAIAIKQCFTTEENVEKKEAPIARRHDFQPSPAAPAQSEDKTETPMVHSGSDGGTTMTSDGGTALTLREACDNFWNADHAPSGGIYASLEKMAKAANFDFPTPNIQTISTICRFQLDAIMRILGKGIRDGDSRIAALVDEFLEKTCGTVTLDAAPGAYELIDCSSLSPENPREACEWRIKNEGINVCKPKEIEKQGKCFDEYLARIPGECGNLPEGESPRTACYRQKNESREARLKEANAIMTACPRKKAVEWGLNFSNIRSLHTTLRANELSTARLYLLNPEVKPTEKELQEYAENLRVLIITQNFPGVTRQLGLRNEEEFKARYIDEVAKALRDKEDALYVNSAGFFETVWEVYQTLK